MRILVNSLSARALSGWHVLRGHLRQLAIWSIGEHEFVLLHDRDQRFLTEDLPENVQSYEIGYRLESWLARTVWESTQLSRLIRQRGIDLLFTVSGTASYGVPVPQVSLALNPWCLVPSIQKRSRDQIKAAVQRWAYRRAMRSADMMFFCSEHLRSLYRRNNPGGRETKTAIAYIGLEEQTWRAVEESKNVQRDPGLIVTVSAMASWKGVEHVLRALRVLSQEGIDFRLRIVGPWDAAYRRSIEQLIGEFGLDDRVTITGKVTKAELHRHYAEASVYCLLSHLESFGIPAVEAQAFGTPVVGSTVCAMPEVCGDGGLFAAPDDLTSCANHLRTLLTDESFRTQLADRALANAQQFRWDHCSKPLKEMYQLVS
jgi:glycosyltransferase involved in cell wall biosynthesis